MTKTKRSTKAAKAAKPRTTKRSAKRSTKRGVKLTTAARDPKQLPKNWRRPLDGAFEALREHNIGIRLVAEPPAGMTQAELRRHLEAAKVDALIYAGQEPAPTSFEDMRLTNRPLHNGSVGLAEDAPVLDVVLNMFVSYDDDVSTRRFTPTIMRAVADELALIEVAPRDGGFAGEVHRVACRARNQLLAAEWLDDKLEAAERARKAKAVQS